MTSPFHATERVLPPSTAALVIAAAILAGVTGFFIGQGASLGVFGAGSRGQGGGKGKERKSWPNSYDVKVHGESEEEEEEGDEESEEEGGGGGDRCVREEYGGGKIAAQCSHATLACYKHYLTRAPDSPILKRWERGGQAKVALQVKSEEELLVLQAQAVSLGLCAQVIQDAGRTQIASGSRTVLGILGPRGVVDGVTGGLKLL
ncbi:PTH2 family peptidyl-tRNA hydrolase [Blastomyces dermatitidis ATCC 26199]|nr:PTH2 family peptidyl-tRNA hydrolase [Blastomyces dermatitidis ATCC 26199]